LEEVKSGGNTCSNGKRTHFGKALWSFFNIVLGILPWGGKPWAKTTFPKWKRMKTLLCSYKLASMFMLRTYMWLATPSM
jgi:hypothetical protein